MLPRIENKMASFIHSACGIYLIVICQALCQVNKTDGHGTGNSNPIDVS